MGEMGSSCLTPLLLINQVEVEPLISKEKEAKERQFFI